MHGYAMLWPQVLYVYVRKYVATYICIHKYACMHTDAYTEMHTQCSHTHAHAHSGDHNPIEIMRQKLYCQLHIHYI